MIHDELNKKMAALLSEQDSLVTNLSNASALLNEYLNDINWVGFYYLDGNVLRLGPFQGRVACVSIPVGRGVCGTAAAERKTVVVRDVHEFEGHIACDCASNSEIVVPIIHNSVLLGVLDIDSPNIGRFCDEDKNALKITGEIIGQIWAKTKENLF